MRSLIVPLLYTVMANSVEARNFRQERGAELDSTTYCFGEPNHSMALTSYGQSSESQVLDAIGACGEVINSSYCPSDFQSERFCLSPGSDNAGPLADTQVLTNAQTDPALKACVESKLNNLCNSNNRLDPEIATAVIIGSFLGCLALLVVGYLACKKQGCLKSDFFASREEENVSADVAPGGGVRQVSPNGR